MRLFLVTFLLLKIFSPAYGNTIYYLTKIPNLQVYDLTASNGIKYLKAEKSFKVGIVKNNVQCNKPSENNIKNKFKLIKRNLEKYEKDFLEKINLKYVVLCENLKVSGIRTAGVPNHKVKTLIIDIKSDPRYFERSIHHELFHMADESYDNLFSYEEWEKFNIPSFQYAECSTCSNRSDLSLIKDSSGFITEYSMSTASEDMAEIFSFMMTDIDDLSIISQKDSILINKINFIVSEIRKIDNNFKFK